MSSTVSRVLYQTAIYLDLLLPAGSSSLPGTQRATVLSLSGLASGGVYTAFPVTRKAVSSYLAFSPLPVFTGGYFLLHYPGSYLHRTLSGTLPCEARTFLICTISRCGCLCCSLTLRYFNMTYRKCKDFASKILVFW